MNDSSKTTSLLPYHSLRKMDIFSAVAARQHVPFDEDSMSEDQLTCIVLVKREREKISSIPHRWLILQDVIIMVTGYGRGDEEEAITDDAFSSIEFFTVFNGIVNKSLQLDYLLCCIAKAVCVVHRGFEKHFMSLIRRLFKPKAEPRYTPSPYKYDSCTDEQLSKYQRRDSDMWPCWKTRLKELEEEQTAFEHTQNTKIFEHWEKPTAELNTDEGDQCVVNEDSSETLLTNDPSDQNE